MGHWPKIARQWEQVGLPLRPAAEDLAICAEAVEEWMRSHGAPRVLLLGVTPELYHLPWPEGTDLLAVDRTQAMIDAVWPGPPATVLCSDWLDLALPEGCRDIVLCDGGLHFAAYPREQRRLVRLLGDMLSDGGLCIFRLFVPPSQRESPDAVLAALLEGQIPSLNALKLRLWMALLESAEKGVALATVWRTVHEAAPDLDALAARLGWPAEHLRAIDTYRGSPERYHLVTAEQASELFCRDPGGFELRRVCVPSYELGEQCPTLVVRRCPGAPEGRDTTRRSR
jgi:hypothetical protein